MVVSMEDHRSPKFPQLALECLNGLKPIFKTTTGTPFIFPSSGTGCWEAALMNCLSPGDKVVIARFGQFSHLWADMSQRLGLEVEILDCEWGEGAPIERYRHVLEADTGRKIKAVLATHNETATGVTSDIAGLRKAMDEVGHPAFLFVDAVSSLGSIDFRMDEWKVDVCVSGSQKGLMLPAGLGITCVSEKALEARRSTAKNPRCYFDYLDMINQNKNGYFPYTPALSLLYGLKESLRAIEDEGLENIFKRHAYLAAGTRAAIQQGWKLDVCAKAPQWYSDTVSAVVVPEGVDAAKIIDRAFRRYNLSLGAGLSKVAGRVFRIGHVGDMNELGLLSAIGGAELAMLDQGVKIEPGSGVAAAQRWWRENEAQSSGTTGGMQA
jgi:alanine-glyoxylate transaminase/serine-glyoxylate transaminase/serine-pyruvate transaminase